MEKAQDMIYKIKGIRQIVLGIVWCIFVFAQEIISAIAVLISFVCGNSTYTYNGEKVTAIQFIFGQVSIFQLIMFAFGILIIALGIRDLASYKKR